MTFPNRVWERVPPEKGGGWASREATEHDRDRRRTLAMILAGAELDQWHAELAKFYDLTE